MQRVNHRPFVSHTDWLAKQTTHPPSPTKHTHEAPRSLYLKDTGPSLKPGSLCSCIGAAAPAFQAPSDPTPLHLCFCYCSSCPSAPTWPLQLHVVPSQELPPVTPVNTHWLQLHLIKPTPQASMTPHHFWSVCAAAAGCSSCCPCVPSAFQALQLPAARLQAPSQSTPDCLQLHPTAPAASAS